MNFPSIHFRASSRNSGGSTPKKIIFVALVLVLLAPVSLVGFTKASASSPSNVIFTSPVNLSNDAATMQAKYPWVASSGNYVYVAWTEGAHGIFLRVSNNNGAAGSWTPTLTVPATRLSVKGGTTNYPVMSANGSNVYVAWTQSLTSGGNAETFVAASSNNGASFTTTELSINLTTYSSDTPFIATYGNNAYVIWHAVTSTGAASVWVSSSTNSGQKWSTALQLDAKSGQADEPQIAAWGSYVYVTWDRNGAWFDVSANNGATWSSPVNLNPGGSVPAGQVREPWIAASGPNVYVTWNDNSGYGTTNGKIYDPYIMVSNNNGKNWNQNSTPKGAKINLMPTSTSSWEIQDAAVGSSVYVAWRDHTPAYTTNGDNLLISSANGGLSWTPTLNTQTPTDVSNDNQITGWSNGIHISGSTVALAYLSDCVTGLQEPSPNTGAGDCGMMVSYSNNGGASFYPELNVSNDRTAGPITDIASSNFAVSGTDVYVAWQDNAAANFQVYFSMTDGTVITAPSLSSTPVKGAVSTIATVSGSNFKPSMPISVDFDGHNVTDNGAVVSDSSGSFSMNFIVPPAVAGSHTLSATDGTNALSNNFNVVAKTIMTPVKGPTGTLISLTGNGFAASMPISLTFDGTNVTDPGAVNSNGSGSFSALFTVPQTTGGKHTVMASDGTNSVSGTYTVVTKISITPKSVLHTKLPTTITVTGTGFASGSMVTITFDGTPMATVTSASNGIVPATMFIVPSGTSIGSHSIQAMDATGNSATATFNVN